jgi:hypothetical protein
MWYIENKGDKLMLKPRTPKVNNFWDNRESAETHYARNKKKIADKARKTKEKKDLQKGA